jgi:hypothetical protein
MFSTCLVCHRSLGDNDAIETFPVGQRLAFDEQTGRLWAVCKPCGHWNLTPIEERWEAIEACERLYRESRIKAATDNIGITTLRSGLDLIRVGKPKRPELSAWRYGPRIIARRKKGALLAVGGAAITGVAGAAVVGASLGAVALMLTTGGGLGFIGLAFSAFEKLQEYREYERDVMTVRANNGHRYYLKQKHLRFVSLEPHDSPQGWQLAMQHENGLLNLAGMQAALTAGQLLAHLNARGASKKTISQAALNIADASDAQQFIRNAIKLRDSRRRNGQLAREKHFDSFGLRYEERLAVEMAMHEDAERQALEGELGALEDAWREAEEIAKISDGLFDSKIEDRFQKMKSGAR